MAQHTIPQQTYPTAPLSSLLEHPDVQQGLRAWRLAAEDMDPMTLTDEHVARTLQHEMTGNPDDVPALFTLGFVLGEIDEALSHA